MALSKRQRSLKSWTKQKWRTKSGKPSTQGSEYLNSPKRLQQKRKDIEKLHNDRRT